MQADSSPHAAGRRPLTAEEKYLLLLQISERISGTLDLDEILHHVLDSVRATVAYDAAGIFVLTRAAPSAGPDPRRQMIAGMASRGFPARPADDEAMLRQGKGIIGHVIHTGECVVAPDVRQDAHYVVGREGTLSEIAVAIVTQGRTIGALNLESDALGAYSPADLDVLRFFARASAISIEKAMLHRQALERQHIHGQLRIAHDIQARLLPRRDFEIPGYDLAGTSVPTFDIGGEFGVDRLSALVEALGGRTAADIVLAAAEATREFAGTDAYQDDFTLLAVRRHAVA